MVFLLAQFRSALPLIHLLTLLIQPNPHQQQQREQHSHEQSLLEISAAGIGHESYEGRSAGAAHVPRKCQQCKQ